MVTWIESEKGTFFHSEINMLTVEEARNRRCANRKNTYLSGRELFFFFLGNNEQDQPALINQTRFLIVIILNPLCH